MSNTFLLFLGIIGYVSSASISSSTEASSSASTEAVSLEDLVTGEGCIKVKDCRVRRGAESCEATEFHFYQHETYGAFCCTLNVDMGEATAKGNFNLLLLISGTKPAKPAKPASDEEEEAEEEAEEE